MSNEFLPQSAYGLAWKLVANQFERPSFLWARLAPDAFFDR